jgi:hypothetical protein
VRRSTRAAPEAFQSTPRSLCPGTFLRQPRPIPRSSTPSLVLPYYYRLRSTTAYYELNSSSIRFQPFWSFNLVLAVQSLLSSMTLWRHTFIGPVVPPTETPL